MVSMKKCVIAGVFLALLAALPINPVSSQTATTRTQQLKRQFVPGRLLDLLKRNADDLGPTGWDVTFGNGRVNAARAVSAAAATRGVVDTVAPTVSIVSPQFGQQLSGPATSVQVAAVDNVRVAKAELYVDGVLVATSTSAPFTMKWNSRKAAAGAHELHCKAYDASGNAGSSAPITVFK